MKGRILGIDYGRKRVGIAATDPMQIIVSPVDTVDEKGFHEYIDSYLSRETVVSIVMGYPYRQGGLRSPIMDSIDKAVEHLRKRYPDIPVHLTDESYTSSDAMQVLIQAGVKRKKRRDKKLLDKMSAVLILQKYLGHI